MINRCSFRALTLLFTVTACAIAAGPEAFFGRWKQLTEKTGGTILLPVAGGIVEIKPTGDNRVSVTITEQAESGKTANDEYVFSLDGSPVKNATGVESPGRSFRQLGPTVWEWTNKTPQQQTTGYYVVSKDGKMLTISGHRQRADGTVGYFQRVFEKQ